MKTASCSLLLAALLAGCAQAPATSTSAPAVASAAPRPADPPQRFLARLVSLEGCPPGQALFDVPWEHSPQYDPLVRFIRAPDPVRLCLGMPMTLARQYAGRMVPLERVDGHYRLQGATSPAPAR